MYVHRCALCGLSREAVSATLPDPTCARCGCRLEALAAHQLAAPETVLRPRDLPSGVLAAVSAVLAAPLVLAAARVGAQHGGPVTGAAAFVLAVVIAFLALTPPRR